MGTSSQQLTPREISLRANAAVATLVPKLLKGARIDPTRRHYEAGSVGGEPGQSLKVDLTGPTQGLWKDFNAPEGTDEHAGDMLKLIAVVKFGGWSNRASRGPAIAWAKSELGLDDLDPERLKTVRREVAEAGERNEAQAAKNKADKLRSARALWNGSAPIAGTPALAYLEGRGIDFGRLGRVPGSLRYCPDLWCAVRRGKHPAMIACIMGLDGKLLGVHRTYLDLSAGKGGPVRNFKVADHKGRLKSHKLSLGWYQGGCIPLWKGASDRTLRELPAGTPVYVSEGIEDGLSIALAMPGARVVAGVALDNMGGLQLPTQAGPIIFVGQNDPEDSKAVEAFERTVRRQQEAGRKVQTIFPRPEYKDFNDQLRSIRIAAVVA